MNIIKDKTIILTGATGLVGKELTKYFLDLGCNMILTGRNSDKIIEHSKELKKYSTYTYYHLDLNNKNSIMSFIEYIKDIYSIDVLINNAAMDAKIGSLNNVRFEDYPINNIIDSVSVNTIGTISLTQEICKIMLKQGYGNIINVGSIYSILSPNHKLYDKGQYKPIDYIVSKSYIPNFTRYLAVLYAKNNIRCNSILPSGINNNYDDNFLNKFSELVPIGRIMETKELTGLFEFLCSDSSSYITGQNISIDGGWSAW